ncbi:gamma-tubulin complex component 2 isoform X1 [Falco cherrug]|uniref:gamma-tubulin complex component 2 isoform X1 n=2 Tax=Falco cherrug TaxID=345164 RepID=UPI00247A1918|nr:gamma-tubulin complex component 2 isoform X1 [Falco cherrug]
MLGWRRGLTEAFGNWKGCEREVAGDAVTRTAAEAGCRLAGAQLCSGGRGGPGQQGGCDRRCGLVPAKPGSHPCWQGRRRQLVASGGSMSEFRIHHDVNELLSLLHVHGGEGAEVYIDLLQKNRTPYVTTTVSAHSAKVKIAEFSRTPEDFLKKYDELKSKNTRHLDSLVYLLSKLTEDKETLQYLQQNAKERAELAANAATSGSTNFSIPSSTSKISLQELEELRKQLGSVTANSSVQQPVELTRKILRDKQNKKNSGQPIPVFPSWVYERPALIGDFLIGTSLSTDTTVPIGTLPLASQESVIVEDLLYVLIGVDGRYITAQPLVGRQNRAFSVDPNLDLSIKELVTRILPVAASYSAVTRFIEEKSSFEYGQVNHALAAAMRTLIKEYMILITQLEHLQRQGLLSLQKLWFYIQPTMRTLEILASLATSVDKGECMGGSTLSLLHDKTFNYTGDSQAQELCLYLTKAASVPYFEILEKWIYRGIINDPYSEFMVEEHELQKEKIQEDYNDKYWDQRYTVVQQQIPSFLQKMADKILSTGKYLNVVRECGRDVTCPVAKEVIYTLKERAYVEQIEKAYNYASKVLLDFLMEEKELVAHLRSIKHYFLMDQGDFFVHFMDLTEEELKKPVDDIITTRLEALLELALRMSTANTDPFKDDLKIDLMPHDLITQLLRVLAIETKQEKAIISADPTELTLSGLEAFSFDYIKWPLSLIINRKALTRYQMLFRHMFYCKHVERQLCNVWISSKTAKQFSLHSAKWFAGAFTLRQRMLNFVQNIQYYMMFEVMEPTWHILEKNLKLASNIDDVLSHHTSFLDNCLKDCMLTNPELLKIFSKLMSVCVMFTNCMQRFTQSMKLDSEMDRLTLEHGTMLGPPTEEERAQEIAKKKLTNKLLAEHADSLHLTSGFEATINKFDSNFSTHLLDLLDKLSVYSTNDCEHSMLNIIYRLDFNGFYTERLEHMSAERSQKAAPLLPRLTVPAQ